MMSPMGVAAFAVVAVLVSTCHGGEYVVVRAPPSVQFDRKSSDSLPLSDLPLFALAMFGYGPQPEMQWTGLYQISPFRTLNAVVFFTVITSPASPVDRSLLAGFEPDTVHFQTVQDDDEFAVDEIIDKLADRKFSTILDFRLQDDGQLDITTDVDGPFAEMSKLNAGELIGSGGNSAENATMEADVQLAVELAAVRRALDTLTARRSKQHSVRRATQDFYHFRLAGLSKLAARYGPKSTQHVRGLALIKDTIRQAADVFSSIYDGNAVVQIATTMEVGGPADRSPDGVSSRRRRQLLQSTPTETNITDTLNLAPSFSWLYPEMFNIGLWFTVVFTLIVFGVAWCMWFIDPGYDSVIYRLTTPPRMKTE